MEQEKDTAPRPPKCSRPLKLSIIAMICAVLITLACGLSCLLLGFDSLTDGGRVTGINALAIGLILGIFPAGPPVVISLISLVLSFRDRHEAEQKPIVNTLSLTALCITLFFMIEACRISG